jgi:protein-tyrosine phosphatase
LESENVHDWSKLVPKIVPKDFPVDVPARKPDAARAGLPNGIPRGWPEDMKEIFWIEAPPGASPGFTPPRLAIVLRPRGGQFLRSELIKFKEAGIRTLVSLMEAREAMAFGLAEEPDIADELGLMFLPYPLRDHSVPTDPVSFRGFVQDLAERLKAGRAVGIHCQGSIGRATVTAACALIHLGWKPAAALAAIQEARGCQVPDMQEQEDWILNYKA